MASTVDLLAEESTETHPCTSCGARLRAPALETYDPYTRMWDILGILDTEEPARLCPPCDRKLSEHVDRFG